MGWSDVENGLKGGGGGLLRIPGDEICKIVWPNGVSWDLRIEELGCLFACDVHRDSNAVEVGCLHDRRHGRSE